MACFKALEPLSPCLDKCYRMIEIAFSTFTWWKWPYKIKEHVNNLGKKEL